MSVFAPLLNIGISLAIFFVEGNTLVLNKILHMCVKGLYISTFVEMDNNEVPFSIFLDLSKAFDTLDHNTLL